VPLPAETKVPRFARNDKHAGMAYETEIHFEDKVERALQLSRS
jgi:hypothetical protein